MKKTVKIAKWGNSQGIRISKAILHQLAIDDIDTAEVTMEVADGHLIVSKADDKSKLMTRFADYDYQQYLNDSDRVADLGSAVGREIR